MTKSDGGPAFPTTPGEYYGKDIAGVHGGMTLRDYFASKAMESFALHSAQNSNSSNPGDYESYTADAYLWADAMLAEREKEQ